MKRSMLYLENSFLFLDLISQPDGGDYEPNGIVVDVHHDMYSNEANGRWTLVIRRLLERFCLDFP